jgi:hypothetical protein
MEEVLRMLANAHLESFLLRHEEEKPPHSGLVIDDQ